MNYAKFDPGKHKSTEYNRKALPAAMKDQKSSCYDCQDEKMADGFC